MNRVAVVVARGIEGCGVTKFTHEQARWLKSHGYEFRVFSMSDKYYARKYTHDTSLFTPVKFASSTAVDEMIAWCNTCDYVVVNSLPPKENGHTSALSDEAYDNWARAIREIKSPIVLIQHDHKIYSIKRNALMDEVIAAAKVVFVHSATNDFAEYVSERDAPRGLDHFFDEEPSIPAKKVVEFQPGCSFTRDRWIDAKDQDALHHKWIGRSTSWKGYRLMFEFARHLRPMGALVTLEGIDKSPGFLSIKGNYEFNSFVGSGLDKIDKTEIEHLHGDLPAVFSMFTNEKMLRRMARCGFGYQTSILDPKFISRSIEYTHCEVLLAGVVPVFRAEYGAACRHRVTGDALTESKNNFTVWLSHENQEECVNIVKKLTSDVVLRDEWRNGAFEFYRDHQDSEYVFSELTKNIEAAVRDG